MEAALRPLPPANLPYLPHYSDSGVVGIFYQFYVWWILNNHYSEFTGRKTSKFTTVHSGVVGGGGW